MKFVTDRTAVAIFRPSIFACLFIPVGLVFYCSVKNTSIIAIE
jgi:formate/nitrite transporter FocA (FNT family)